MFSPRGTVIDEPAAEGLIHFVVALRDDIELTTRSDFSDRRAPINQEALADSDPNDPENDRIFDRSRSLLLQTHTGLPADSSVSGDRALVTIYASTGKIGSPPLDLDDFDNDGWADDPFRFAVRGEVPNE
jgi:hypothetical protein